MISYIAMKLSCNKILKKVLKLFIYKENNDYLVKYG